MRYAIFFFAFTSFLVATGAAANRQDSPAASKSATPESTGPSPVVVELFTSEGCSSCPPADVMLQKLDQYQPIPGAQLIVLSEHVTYWDQDGWKDPNSSAALTDRQSAYELALGEKSSFTPQIVIDGTRQITLANTQQQMDAIFHEATVEPKVPVHIEQVSFDGGDSPVLHARVETGENFDKHNADVYVAVALDHVESQVLRGENGGKHLVHVAVVEQITKVGKLQKGKTFAQDVQLKLKPGSDPKNIRVVAFVQEGGPGKVIGAALRKPAA